MKRKNDVLVGWLVYVYYFIIFEVEVRLLCGYVSLGCRVRLGLFRDIFKDCFKIIKIINKRYWFFYC